MSYVTAQMADKFEKIREICWNDVGEADGVNVMWDNKMNKENNRPLSTGICVAAEEGGGFKSKVHGFLLFAR